MSVIRLTELFGVKLPPVTVIGTWIVPRLTVFGAIDVGVGDPLAGSRSRYLASLSESAELKTRMRATLPALISPQALQSSRKNRNPAAGSTMPLPSVAT